jgi:ankyrin repeat protein
MHAVRRDGSRWFLLFCSVAFLLHAGRAMASGSSPEGERPRGSSVSRARTSAASTRAKDNPARKEIERRRSGFTPSDFVEVAAHWDVDLVRLYLDAGADPNAPHQYRTTALGEAALWDRPGAIDLLVSRGARPDDPSQDETPLYIAAAQDNVAAVKALIKARANVNRPKGPDSPEITPLWQAASSRRWDAVRLLLEAGADPNLFAGGGPPIVYAAQFGHVPTVRLLLEKGAKGPGLANALYVAVLQGRPEVVRILLEAGVPVPEDRDALVKEDSDIDPNVKRLLANPPKPGAGAKGKLAPMSPSVPSSAKAVATVLKPGEAEGTLDVEARDPVPSRLRYALNHAWALRVDEEWRVVLADRPLDRATVESWAREAVPPTDPELRGVVVTFTQLKQRVSSQLRVDGRTVTVGGNVFEAGPFDGRALSGRARTNSPGELEGKMYFFEAAFVAPLPEPWSDGISPEETARAEGTDPGRRFREYERALRERDVTTLAQIVPEAFGPDQDPEAIRENLLTARIDQLRETKLKVTSLDDESASLLVTGKDEDGWPRTKRVYLKKQKSEWTMGF